MARIAKSLVPPEQGYAHREHRSSKNRKPAYQKLRNTRRWKQRLEQKRRDREFHFQNPDFTKKGLRKGKWI